MDDATNDIARRDELLELLYWFEGEGFAGAATLDAIARFVALPPREVSDALDTLCHRGDVIVDAATGEYRLTDTGRREGARRFADSFAPMLAQGHGECNDPQCDCHHDPHGGACRQRS